MRVPNWKHHSKKEKKRKLKPQALRAARERRRQLIKSLRNPPSKGGFFINKNKMPTAKHLISKKRLLVDQYKKETPCADCGGLFHPVAMDFHHKDGVEKKDSISRLIQDGYSMKTIYKEMEKCLCLCSNCHRVRHLGDEIV
jgi:hypothetical protein